MRFGELGKNLLLGAIAFAVLFGAAELATRLVFSSNTVLNINIGGFRSYHPTRGTQLTPNYRAGEISINSHGILGPEFAIEPDPGSVRILAIGDSVTFSPAARNYPRVMEERLRAFFPGAPIEVIAAAVPGYSSHEALDWYRELLHRLGADIATIYLGWNDMGQFHPFGLRYKNPDYRERTLLGRLMEMFYVLRVPYFFLGRIEQRRPVDRTPPTAEQRRILDAFVPTHFERNLVALIEALRRDGTSVHLIGLAGLISVAPTEEEIARMHFPRNLGRSLALYRAIYDAYARSLERVAAETGTPLLDLGPLIATPEQRAIFSDTMHVGFEGAERYGAFLAESLRGEVAERLGGPAGG